MIKSKTGKIMSKYVKYTQSNPYIKNKTDLDLLTDKGVYPFDYMNSFEKFDETKLPRNKIFIVNCLNSISPTRTTLGLI